MNSDIVILCKKYKAIFIPYKTVFPFFDIFFLIFTGKDFDKRGEIRLWVRGQG